MIWPLTETVMKVVQYVAIQCGLRGMSPKSIKDTYLPGISSTFIRTKVANNFREATRSEETKTHLEGWAKVYAKLHPVSGRMKIAFGMDLAREMKIMMNECREFSGGGRSAEDAELMRFRLYLCAAVGINYMLRGGEHIEKKGGAPSGMTHRTVVSLDADGRMIPFATVGDPSRPVMLSCNNTLFSKTDHSGFGRRPWHARQQGRIKADVCVVQLMERWTKTIRDRGGKVDDNFYDCPGLPKLNKTGLHAIMRRTVARVMGCEVPPGVVAASHSFRYGGATTLAIAGLPQYLIAHYGGWTADSKSLRRYIVPSEESIARVSSHMTDQALQNPSAQHLRDTMTRMVAATAATGGASRKRMRI